MQTEKTTKAGIAYGKEIKKLRQEIFSRKNQTYFAEKINELLPKSSTVFLDQKKVSNLETGTINNKISETLIKDLDKIFTDMGYEIDRDVLNDFLTEVKKSYHTKKNKTVAIIYENDNILARPNNKTFKYYEGKYFCMFHSTDSSDPKCIHAEMEIIREHSLNQCITTLIIKEGDKAIKEYDGLFVFNTHYNMWYSVMVGKEKQEICLIAAPHFNSTIRNNQLNVALVITTSAGMQKRPTMHRMFISRNKINEEQEKLILAQLKFNDDTISISETSLTHLEADIKKELKDTTDQEDIRRYNAVLKCIEEIRKSPSEKYYKIDEAIIYDSNKISNNKSILSYAICKIRQYTDNKYYNKLSDTVHEICTKVMNIK